jgi:hypothetical protein
MSDVPKMPTKVRVSVILNNKPYRTYEGYDKEQLLRDANVTKTELVASGQTDVVVKSFEQILG